MEQNLEVFFNISSNQQLYRYSGKRQAAIKLMKRQSGLLDMYYL